MIRDDSATSTDEELRIALASLPADSPLLSSCDYVLSTPGKRFRAALVSDAAGYGPRPDDPLVGRMAIAIELFHSATLAHDDVVDDGRLRRGKPTIGAHAGNLAASLTGGWLFARAVELIAAAGAEATARFAETAAIVCEGEMLEARDLHNVDRSREGYLEAIEAKTARLIAFAAWLGAEAGGAGAEQKQRLERYGESVGIAFQIADDILDLLADPQVSGKTPGSDLRQGTFTLPVILAFERDPTIRTALLHGVEEDELPELVDRIADSGAIEAALEACEEWIERARDALPIADPGDGRRERLLALAGTVAGRVEEMARR